MSIIPTAFGPTTERSEDTAQEFILFKLEPVGRQCLYDIGPGVGEVT